MDEVTDGLGDSTPRTGCVIKWLLYELISG
jgi:hypothetical protein